MKQKQVKASPKVAKQTKVTKKVPPQKKIQDLVEESEEEVVKKVVKPVTKKAAATKGKKVVVVEEPSEEEVDDVEEVEDSIEEVEDEGDDENGDEEEEVEEGDDDDDDEGPTEEVTGKEEPTIPSKVKSGEIPASVPLTRVVYVNKLPKKCKQVDIVEAFGKYGAIDQIHIVTTTSGTFANISYKTEKAASKAIADDKKVKVLDSFVWVSQKRDKSNTKQFLDRERTVRVKNFKTGTTEEDLKEHFETCGDIENIKMGNKFNSVFAFITFADKSSVPLALKLHNSLLKDVNIKVFENGENPPKSLEYDATLTIMLRNKQGFEGIDAAKLESIFEKCGEIDEMNLVCKKNILAFITFKNKDGVQEALKLSGKTEEDIELDIEPYNPIKNWTSIHVSNLSNECSVEDLTHFFSKAGEVVSVSLRRGYAIIRFKDSEGYCKSFLYNECFLKGHIIFVEPHSTRKKTVFKSKTFKNKGYKRKAQNGHSVFTPKKPKTQ